MFFNFILWGAQSTRSTPTAPSVAMSSFTDAEWRDQNGDLTGRVTQLTARAGELKNLNKQLRAQLKALQEQNAALLAQLAALKAEQVTSSSNPETAVVEISPAKGTNEELETLRTAHQQALNELRRLQGAVVPADAKRSGWSFPAFLSSLFSRADNHRSAV